VDKLFLKDIGLKKHEQSVKCWDTKRKFFELKKHVEHKVDGRSKDTKGRFRKRLQDEDTTENSKKKVRFTRASST